MQINKVLSAVAVGMLHQVSPHDIQKAIVGFVPSENRLQRHHVLGKSIVFDGDVTSVSRLTELATNHAKRSTLILTRLYYPWNKDFISAEMTTDVVPRFDRVFLLDPKPELGSWKGEGAIRAAPSDLNAIVEDSEGYIVLHHAGYFRRNASMRNAPALPNVDRLLQLSDRPS